MNARVVESDIYTGRKNTTIGTKEELIREIEQRVSSGMHFHELLCGVGHALLTKDKFLFFYFLYNILKNNVSS